jgi:hypothetical protein
MPDVPSGLTHLPTIMIAERLSAQITSLNSRGGRSMRRVVVEDRGPEPSEGGQVVGVEHEVMRS